jgi:sortase A
MALLIVTVLTAGMTVAAVRIRVEEAGAAPAPTVRVEQAVEPAPPPAPPVTALPAADPAPAAAPAATQPVAPPPPAEEYKPTPLVRVGTIRIPKLGAEHPLYEGITLTVLDQGPGHWPGSAMPGQRGNAVVAGHRVTHSRPFRYRDRLVPGDEVLFDTADGTFTYRVTGHEIVKPTDVWIVNPTPDATMTLFACHPPGSARQRYVVRGTLVPPA